MSTSLKFYRHPISGHCHRVELLLNLLEVPFEPIAVDLLARAQKLPEFLAKNPLGQVPVIEDGSVTLSDSNAILVYLALRYDPTGRYYPREPRAAAEVQRWLSLAAGELVQGLGRLRLHGLLKAPIDHQYATSAAQQLLTLLEATLAAQPYLVGSQLTLADIALYAYTARGAEGGVSLEPFPSVRAWLARIEALPRFVPMARAQLPAAAAREP